MLQRPWRSKRIRKKPKFEIREFLWFHCLATGWEVGPATGVGGVAGVRRRGWKVWLESGDRGGRCGWGPTRGWEVWPGSGDGGGKKCSRKKTITKLYQKNGGTPKP